MPNIWLRRLRRVIGWFVRKPASDIMYGNIEFSNQWVNTSGADTQDFIANAILNHIPLLVTRFGSTEMASLMDSSNPPTIKNTVAYLFHRRDYVGYREWVLNQMSLWSGFYPSTPSTNMRYYHLVCSMLYDIDMLGSWMKQDKLLLTKFNKWGGVKRCKLSDLEPFRFSNPWSKALEGKKVLVIHPFEKTIRYQYIKNRTHLFVNPNVLPKFELLTIKAVQSIAGNRPSEFPTWFDALEWMEREVDKINFDVAIIGCGAYGMPLAGYIKKKGKIAIHLGGATQYLFGIRSKRADDSNPEICAMYNDYWIRPLPEDRPKNLEKVEGGCYW